jgi:small subunit ribosomal protein S18
MAKVAPKRGKNKDNARRSKKKISVLNSERIGYVDYKDVNLLRRFMSERAKIRARRVTGNDTQQQREIARAIRVAREMALLPYSVRQVTHRSKGRRGERGERDREMGAPEGAETPGGEGAEGVEELEVLVEGDEGLENGDDVLIADGAEDDE